MRTVLLASVAFLCCTQAQAITWEFAEPGGSQGWQARIWLYSGGEPYPLPLEIADGVLRVPMPDFEGGRQAITLMSPEIRASSALFDQVRIRLRLVAVLAEGPQNVNSLAELVATSQAVVSQQLRILRMSGLVDVTRTGGFAYYRLIEPHLQELLRCMVSCAASR